MEQKKRPTGITILAILALIGGIFMVLAGILALTGSAFLATQGEGGVAVLAIIIGLIMLVAGVLNLVFAVGAWSLKPWAWTLGIIVQVISLVMAIVQGATSGNWGNQALSIIIAIIILYYLNTRGVKEAFGKA
jgi:uncharacterized membrane protein (DUF2068 family)